MKYYKIHIVLILSISIFDNYVMGTGTESSQGNTDCLMPAEIPENLSIFFNQTSWNALRQRQAQQMARRGGCPQKKGGLPCQIYSKETVTLTGSCRSVDGIPMCAVFDRRYHTATTMWPKHRECRSRRIVNERSRRYRYDITYLDRVAARKRAQSGAMPSNVGNDGNALPSTSCTVKQRIRTHKDGNCVLVRNTLYACKSGNLLRMWHPVCSYLVENEK